VSGFRMEEVPPGGEQSSSRNALPAEWRQALEETGYRWMPGSEADLGYVHSEVLRRGLPVARMLQHFTPETWVESNLRELQERERDPAAFDRRTARLVWRGRWLRLGCYALMAWAVLGWALVGWRYWLLGLAVLFVVNQVADRASRAWD
jgi:hypothetical protein